MNHEYDPQAAVERWARLRPGDTAISDSSGAVDYGELEELAEGVEGILGRLGARPDSVIAVVGARSAEVAAAMLGVVRAGCGYLYVDPRLPIDRVKFMIQDSGAVGMLTDKKSSSLAPDALATFRSAHRVLFAGRVNSGDGAGRVESTGERQLAYVMYTSGTTGEPNGVAVERRSLANLVAWHTKAFQLVPSDRASQIAGFGFDASVWEIWPYLAAGASVHIVPESVRGITSLIPRWLSENNVTVSFLPTGLVGPLMKRGWRGPWSPRLLLTGGDSLTIRPPEGFPPVFNAYGPTEATVVATVGRVRVTSTGRRAPGIGWPIENTYVRLLSPRGEPVAPGEIGELYIGGAGVARGYINRPRLTQERFVKDLFSDDQAAKLYRTGDLAWFSSEEGYEFAGRRDDEVKVRGMRVQPGEIENVVALHPGVIGVGVVVVGGGLNALVHAFVVLEEAVAVEEVSGYAVERLPRYMVPTRWTVVRAMPLTQNGKLDRRRLAEYAQSE